MFKSKFTSDIYRQNDITCNSIVLTSWLTKLTLIIVYQLNTWVMCIFNCCCVYVVPYVLALIPLSWHFSLFCINPHVYLDVPFFLTNPHVYIHDQS